MELKWGKRARARARGREEKSMRKYDIILVPFASRLINTTYKCYYF